MATTPFKYQAPFPLGPDTTEYYLLTKDYVSLCERRSIKETSRKAALAIAVRPSFATFRTGVHSNSETET